MLAIGRWLKKKDAFELHAEGLPRHRTRMQLGDERRDARMTR